MKKIQTNTAFGYIMLVATALIWGSAFVAQRNGMNSLQPCGFNGLRMLMGWFTLTFVIGLSSLFGVGKAGGNGGKESLGTLWRGGLLCGLALGVASLVQQIGIKYTSVGKAGFITTLYIILVPTIGILLGQRSRWNTWGCVLLALLGFFLISNFRPGGGFNRGDIYCLVSAFLFSVHILLLSHFAPKVDGIRLAACQFLVSGIVSLALIPVFGESFPSNWQIIMGIKPLLYTGIVSSGLAYTFQVVAQKWVRPVVASLIMSLESCFAALFGWFLLQESLSIREVAGCIVIFVAVIITTVKEE